eukprot:1810003-Rhodomonas_salina.1
MPLQRRAGAYGRASARVVGPYGRVLQSQCSLRYASTGHGIATHTTSVWCYGVHVVRTSRRGTVPGSAAGDLITCPRETCTLCQYRASRSARGLIG